MISLVEEVTVPRPRSKTGEAITPERRTPAALRAVRGLLAEAEAAGDLDTWRRAKAILGYVDGERVAEMCDALGVNRSSINRWLTWYHATGVDGLRTGKAPGRQPKLTEAQCDELVAVIEAGPQAAGFSSGTWTGPMVADWIARRFGVRFHINYVPRLLHDLGFSVQRPRKRLARADAAAQAVWLRERLPRIKKKRAPAEAS